MEKAWRCGLALLAVAATGVPGREGLGQYGQWGAFRDRAPARCYAIAEPLAKRDGEAFATVASAPDAGARSQIGFRLRRPAASAVAAIAGERVPLTVIGRDAWPRDERGDRRLAALLRAGGLLEVSGHDAAGRRFHDRYPLAGAASAIDAMRLACLRP